MSAARLRDLASRWVRAEERANTAHLTGEVWADRATDQAAQAMSDYVSARERAGLPHNASDMSEIEAWAEQDMAAPVKPTPAQLRYLVALASDEPHPIRVLTRGHQWRVRSNLGRAGLIIVGSSDELTPAGRAAIAERS